MDTSKIDEIILDLIDNVECRLDHHGFCQTHFWLEETECPHSRAKKLLKKKRPDLWKIFEEQTKE